MLKGKRSVSACSLSSCRIRAEALARAFNNRIWPCVWLAHSRSSSADRSDGMANGVDDDEEFFDASPSPLEVGDDNDESVFCQQHSSAATEAGRAKLYELLQQHAADDAIDVFYDVSEDAGLTNMCLRDDDDRTGVIDGIAPECCGQLDDESYFSNNSDINGKDGEIGFGEMVEIELLDSPDSETIGKRHLISPCSEAHSLSRGSVCEECLESVLQTQLGNAEGGFELAVKNEDVAPGQKEIEIEQGEESSDVEKSELQETYRSESVNDENPQNDTAKVSTELSDSPSTLDVNRHSSEKDQKEDTSDDKNDRRDSNPGSSTTSEITETDVGRRNTELSDSPSADVQHKSPEPDQKSVMTPDGKTEQGDTVPDSPTAGEVGSISKGDEVIVQVTKESPSPTSSETSSKTSSPTSARLTVFNELRPKISRSTSLKTGKTPPGTPSKKKIVRFADVLGLDLEDVRHIMSGDLPTIPSSAYTDLDLKDADLPKCEPISETLEVSRRNSWKVNVPGATATNVLYPTFSIPGEQPDFMDRVRHQGVCLETVIVSDMSVQCTCRVMNFGFHKKVIARYTVNDWVSSNDINASYVLGSSNGETDSFAFSIFLSPQNRSLQFALKYEVNNADYWDNNRNQNYCLGYHGSEHMQTYDNILPSQSWQHQFW